MSDMKSERIAIPSLVPGDHFEWCGRCVRLLSVGQRTYGRRPYCWLTVVDTTDDREHRLSYELSESVLRFSAERGVV